MDEVFNEDCKAFSKLVPAGNFECFNNVCDVGTLLLNLIWHIFHLEEFLTDWAISLCGCDKFLLMILQVHIIIIVSLYWQFAALCLF